MSPSPPSPARRRALRAGAAALRKEGYRLIAGADEAGAGPLAGPLVAAAVILPVGARLPGVDDSKRLDASRRERWSVRIRQVAVSWAVAEVSATEVDRIGPLQAAIEGMSRAVGALDPAPDFLLTDARPLPRVEVPQRAVIRGDARHLVIAAASILAKHHRDTVMIEVDRQYPGYGFAQHKGYPSASHLEALARLGPCPVHRRSYAPVRRCLPGQARLFE